MVAREPYRAFAQIGVTLFPEAARPQSFFGAKGISPGAIVHPDARLEIGVTVDPGVPSLGRGPRLAPGTIIGANAVIGPDVRIGRDCSISANAVDPAFVDRQPCHQYPFRRLPWPGWIRLLDGIARTS